MISGQPENEVRRPAKRPKALFTIPTSQLDLPRRIENRLNAARIDTVGALVERTAEELLEVKRLSQKSLDVIKSKLETVGLEFRRAE